MEASSDVTAWGDEWDEVFDVVVVGSGVSGMAAALAAVRRGCSVVVLEKATLPGGTTAKSGGVQWIPNNPLMRKAGIEDPRDTALQYMARVAYPARYDADQESLGLPTDKYRLLEAYYDTASVAWEELADLGAIPYDPVTGLVYPDYHAELPEDATPRGRAIRIRLPEGHAPGIDPTGGQYLMDAMHEVAGELGVDMRCDHRVAHVVRHTETGEVVGLEAHIGRRTALFGARKGVVFCSGGFLHDRELAAEFLRGPVFGGAAAETSTGDFLKIGIEVGAQLGNVGNAWWDQVALEMAIRTPSTIEDVWQPFGDSMIVVNRYGQRVMNEKMPYSERGPVHFEWDAGRREYRNLLLFMVYDDAVANHPSTSGMRHPIPPPGETAPHIISGDTWDELVRAVADRLAAIAPHTGGVTLADGFADGLRASIERFDQLARVGVDDDFHRGEAPIERLWAGPARDGAASATMFPFAEEGPYHCVILAAGALDTKCGPVIDECARVLDVHGEPIPGLFGAGNCIASPAGQAYWGAGGTIGPAMTFGYIAGVHAAEESPRRPG